MIIKTSSVFGNFKWEAEADVDPSQLHALAQKGLLQDLQRSPSTAAEKSMAGYDKRPKGFERNSIGYSDARADVLATALSVIDLGELLGKVNVSVSVEEYFGSEGAEVKYAQARKNWSSKGGDVERLRKLADVVDYTGDLWVGEGDWTYDNEHLDEGEAFVEWEGDKVPPLEFLKAITEYIKGL